MTQSKAKQIKAADARELFLRWHAGPWAGPTLESSQSVAAFLDAFDVLQDLAPVAPPLTRPDFELFNGVPDTRKEDRDE